MARDYTAEEILSGSGPTFEKRGALWQPTDAVFANVDITDLPDDDGDSILPNAGLSGAKNAPRDLGDLYGKTVTLPLAATGPANPFPIVSVPSDGAEHDWNVTVQVLTQASGGTISNLPYVSCVISWGQGAARFQRTILLPPSPLPVKWQIVARSVDISLYYSGGYNPTKPAVMSVACVRGRFSGADAYEWVWSPTPKTGAPSFGLVWTGAGVLGQIHAMMTAAASAGTPLWLLGFDEVGAGAPTGASLLVPGLKLPAFYQAGDDRSGDQKDAPGDMFWNTGLKLALSTSPDSYVAPIGVNSFSADVEVGQ